MKKKMMALSLCAAMSVAIITFAEITPGGKSLPNGEGTQMRDEINRLKAKVELLEYRTKSLETTVEQLKHSRPAAPLTFSAPAPSVSSPSPESSQPPKIWGQKEVNGWTYYIVPCEQTGR
jgi:hypothetical protein